MELNSLFLLHDYLGDFLLKEVSKRLKDKLLKDFVIVRMGGDEFIILVPEFSYLSELRIWAEHILKFIAVPFHIQNYELKLTASIGIAVYPDNANSIESLLKKADSAMYQAKEMGKNNYFIYNKNTNKSVNPKSNLETLMPNALEKQEFEVYFQPLVLLGSGNIYGFETLVRWYYDNKELLLPPSFIPIAEDSSFIIELGWWIFQKTFRYFRNWLDKGYQEIKIALNLSGKQFYQTDFIKKLISILEENCIQPNAIILEINESLLQQKDSQVLEILDKLSSYGFNIFIDNYGIACSSFQLLNLQIISGLKIDKSFIQNIFNNNNKVLLGVLEKLSSNLKIVSIVEGIENKEQLDIIKALSYKIGQGFYFSHPVPAENVLEILEKGYKIT